MHISFIRPPSVIRAPKGLVAFAIGFDSLVSAQGKQSGASAAKDPKE
jgi:hypothetical protein